LLARPALKQQDVVVVGYSVEFLDQTNGLVVHGFVSLAAMAVLHHAHAGSREVDQLLLSPLECRKRKRGGTCIEIHYSGHDPPKGIETSVR
jgi:hypothetical protein